MVLLLSLLGSASPLQKSWTDQTQTYWVDHENDDQLSLIQQRVLILLFVIPTLLGYLFKYSFILQSFARFMRFLHLFILYQKHEETLQPIKYGSKFLDKLRPFS
ncbi:hypothetical protein EIZ39_11140 [Ammoniphilus sp. CFH 90114]|nr:hypothetical protein EIZ39_11140 [Ammoniphilus sp. CFH 90114]